MGGDSIRRGMDGEEGVVRSLILLYAASVYLGITLYEFGGIHVSSPSYWIITIPFFTLNGIAFILKGGKGMKTQREAGEMKDKIMRTLLRNPIDGSPNCFMVLPEYITDFLKEMGVEENPAAYYAIGTPQGEFSVGMWFGPVPTLKECLDMPGQEEGDLIYVFMGEGSAAVREWKKGKWVQTEGR